MDRNAGLLFPGRKRRLKDPVPVHAWSAEFRQQCGMRVQNAAIKCPECLRAQTFHIAAQKHEIDVRSNERVSNGCIEFSRILMCLRGEVEGWNPGPSSPFQRSRGTVIANRNGDAPQNASVRTGVEDFLECASLVRGQNPDVHDLYDQVPVLATL